MGSYILVAGSRNFANAERLAKILEENVKPDDTIIEGGANGVDTMAKEWAVARGIQVVEINAEWGRYGRAAGPKRNDAMTSYTAESGGRAVFIWDGKSKGTRQCIESARKRGINCRVYMET